MTARYATPTEIENWNTHILANPDGGNVFSSFEYSKIKRLTSYSPRYIFANNIAITVLEKRTWPLGVFWYLPKGPGVNTAEQLLSACEAIKPLAKKAGAFVVRVESEIPATSTEDLANKGLIKARTIIPNPSTITLDISSPLDSIMSNLPQKGRHAIRRAERDGVTVKPVPTNEENTKVMYKLLQETASGQFDVRSYNYYKTYWETFSKSGKGQLFFAYFNGDVVAGAYAMSFGKKSTYKDGASIRQRTAYGASHLLQWTVIQWAKSQGSLIHDLCGSPPSSQIDNQDHPHYGIGRFKLSFSKDVKDYIGCYDYVISPVRLFLWSKIGERVHIHLYYKRTKDYYY